MLPMLPTLPTLLRAPLFVLLLLLLLLDEGKDEDEDEDEDEENTGVGSNTSVAGVAGVTGASTALQFEPLPLQFRPLCLIFFASDVARVAGRRRKDGLSVAGVDISDIDNNWVAGVPASVRGWEGGEGCCDDCKGCEPTCDPSDNSWVAGVAAVRPPAKPFIVCTPGEYCPPPSRWVSSHPPSSNISVADAVTSRPPLPPPPSWGVYLGDLRGCRRATGVLVDDDDGEEDDEADANDDVDDTEEDDFGEDDDGAVGKD